MRIESPYISPTSSFPADRMSGGEKIVRICVCVCVFAVAEYIYIYTCAIIKREKGYRISTLINAYMLYRRRRRRKKNYKISIEVISFSRSKRNETKYFQLSIILLHAVENVLENTRILLMFYSFCHVFVRFRRRIRD